MLSFENKGHTQSIMLEVSEDETMMDAAIAQSLSEQLNKLDISKKAKAWIDNIHLRFASDRSKMESDS